jgi:hypothetical protein
MQECLHTGMVIHLGVQEVGSEPPPAPGCNITVNVMKIKLEAIILLNLADLFHKNVGIFHCDPEPLDVFFPSWHEFEHSITVEGGLLQ